MELTRDLYSSAPEATPAGLERTVDEDEHTFREGDVSSEKQGKTSSRRKLVWLCIALVFVALAAAIGGGVGGTMRSRSKSVLVELPPL